MSINYQFGDVDAHGATIRAQAASLEQEHQAIVRDVLAAGDFWGGSGSVACQEFITQLGRNFQVIYQQANSHGQKVQTAGNNMSLHRLRRRLQLGLTLRGVGAQKHTGRIRPVCFVWTQPRDGPSILARPRTRLHYPGMPLRADPRRIPGRSSVPVVPLHGLPAYIGTCCGC